MSFRSILTAVAAAVLALGSVTALSPLSPASAGVRASAAPPGLPGFDVSGSEGDIDWNKAVLDGAAFVFVTATDGPAHQNPDYPRLVAGARGVDLVLGPAHFAVPGASSGAAQADFFMSHGGAWSADGVTLPGTLDLEANPYGTVCYGLSQVAMVAWISAFVNEYHAKTSRWPIIYTTPSWWSQCTGNSHAFAAGDPLFIAGLAVAPSQLPGGWPTYTFWQWASSGTFPGGQDVFNGTRAQLTRLATGT